jgi:excisionase family DNA binding protein
MNNRTVQKTGKILATLREAAEMLAISERTLYGLIQAGEIPTVRLKRAVRIRTADLEAWASRKAGPFVPGPVPGRIT